MVRRVSFNGLSKGLRIIQRQNSQGNPEHVFIHIQCNNKYIHPSGLSIHFGVPRVMKPVPADLGKRRVTPWMSHKSNAGPHIRQTSIHAPIHSYRKFKVANLPVPQIYHIRITKISEQLKTVKESVLPPGVYDVHMHARAARSRAIIRTFFGS